MTYKEARDSFILDWSMESMDCISENIKSMFYSKLHNQLLVFFNIRGNGDPVSYYRYWNVPQSTWDDLIDENNKLNGSVGSLFSKLIRKNAGIKYDKVEL